MDDTNAADFTNTSCFHTALLNLIVDKIIVGRKKVSLSADSDYLHSDLLQGNFNSK